MSAGKKPAAVVLSAPRRPITGPVVVVVYAVARATMARRVQKIWRMMLVVVYREFAAAVTVH